MAFDVGDKVQVREGVFIGKVGKVTVLAGDHVPKRIGVEIPNTGCSIVWFQPTEIEKVKTKKNSNVE